MKNYVQKGTHLTVPAPAGGVAGGDPVLIGALFGFAVTDAVANDPVVIVTEGVFEAPKATGAAWAVGDKLYFDSTAKNLTGTVSTNKLVGYAVAIAASGDATGLVKIDSPIAA